MRSHIEEGRRRAEPGGREIPLSRLNAYLRALGQLRGEPAIPVPQLVSLLQDVTQRELREDCDSWGVTWTAEQLPFSMLARAVRREVHGRKHRDVVIEPQPAEIPGGDGLLDLVREYSDPSSARRSGLIEAAFAYAEARPQHLLASHGDVEQGRTAYRHQVEEARRIVETMLGNGIVIHEVGLGKTITGILVLLELLRRDPELTCLILVPANLRKQWADELAGWTDLKVVREERYDARALRSEPYLLLSIDSAKERRRADILVSRRWGLVLVDEGHWLRNDQTERYRFVYSLRARYRLLLTATPVHNSGYDIFHQVDVVRPGHLGRKAVFAASFMRDERQIENAHDLQQKLAPVLSQCQRHETDLGFPRRRIQAIKIRDRSEDESDLYDNVLSLLRDIYRWHLGSAAFVRRPSGKEQGVSQLVLVSMLVLRELASHPLSALKTLAGPLRDKVERLAAITGAGVDLQKLDEKLKAIVKKYDNTEWGAGKHRKTDHLIEKLPELAHRFGRVIVYVEFRETQKAIVARLTHLEKPKLEEAGLDRRPEVISYHGGLPPEEKDHQVDRFRESEHAWFISTDASGQGLNLQQGRVIVNFDFPWNPMRVEQRIGRVDRIGQESSTVIVQNYITHGTIEEYVYHALREKLNVCEDVLGRVIPRIFQLKSVESKYATPEDVLGIGQIILRSENNEDMRRKFRQFGEDIEAAAEVARQARTPRRRWLDE